MENIQMRNAQILSNRQAMQAQQSTSIAVQGAGGMDAFAMIFAQMASLMEEGQEGENGFAVPEEVLAGLMENLDEDSDDPNLLAMELAASMMVQNPQWIAFLQQDDASAAEMVSALNLPTDVKQFLMDARAAAQNLQNEAVQPFEQAVEQQPVEASEASEASSDPKAGMSDRFAELVSQSSDESADPMEGLQDSFLRNVRAARQLLSNAKSGKEEAPQIDIDKLQNDVASNRYNPLASLENRIAHADFNEPKAPEVDQQIQQGITENLLKGQKEFVIKLRPEGLGEVTVKLLERPGQASILSLVTSSTEAAKLINQKLSVLQEAMRPLQVQVNMAEPDHYVEASQAGSQAYNEHSFLADEQNQQEQNQKNQRSGKSAGKVFSLTGDMTIEEADEQELLAADGLDTYI